MGNDKQLTPQELQAAAKQLDVKNPIMSHKVVGNRVELHLLGGAVVQGPLPGTAPPAAEKLTLSQLETMSKKELYELAQTYEIQGRSSMTAEELREAIYQLQ